MNKSVIRERLEAELFRTRSAYKFHMDEMARLKRLAKGIQHELEALARINKAKQRKIAP